MRRRFAWLLVGALLSAGCFGAGYPPAPAPQAAPAPAGPSLYERLGGVDAIRAVVDDFLVRVGADSRINMFFRGMDSDDLKAKLADLICEASAGPCRYTGRSMREAHAGMHIIDGQFDALVEDLATSLGRFAVGEPEKSQLLALLAGMRRDVVGR